MAPLRTCDCGECRKCKHRAYMNDWYRRPGHAERVRARMREYILTHPDTRPYRPRDPEKAKARNAARSLERQPCEICGNPIVHAHHDDYSKPLEVRWLCRLHHGAVHRTVGPPIA